MKTTSGFGLLLLVVPPLCAAATVIVDPAGAGDFTSLQPALDAAEDGDTILVAPGEYRIAEPLDFNRLPGGEGDPPKNLTVRSADGPEATVIRMIETPDDQDRASVILFQSGEGEASAVIGFTLTGGTGTGDVERVGGGIHVRASSPRVEACTITGNSAIHGGGIFCSDSAAPTVIDCTVTRNTASEDGGGGVYSRDSSVHLDGCVISENVGCGFVCTGRRIPTLNRCTVERNWGGGMHCEACSPDLTACTIASNRTPSLGGGILCSNTAAPILEACRVAGNMAASGGGMCIVNPGPTETVSPLVVNSTFAGNRAVVGAGIFSSAAAPIIVHCTIAGNRGDTDAGVAGDTTLPHLSNSILWGNQPESAYGTTSHCLVGEDPLFVDPGLFNFDRFITIDIAGTDYDLPDFITQEPDFHLRAGSVAIDAGDAGDSAPADAARAGRPCGIGVDIGPMSAAPVLLYS